MPGHQLWFLLATRNASDNKIFRLTVGQDTQTVFYTSNIYKNKHKLLKVTCLFQIKVWRYHWYYSDLTVTESPPSPVSFKDRLRDNYVLCYCSVESTDTKLHAMSLRTSKGQLGLSLLSIYPEEDAEKGTNVLLSCCGSWPASPSLDTIMHTEPISQEYIRNFSLLEIKLDVISYLRTVSTVLFVMQNFLAQSLVHGAINCKVLTSVAYMVLYHLQLDFHVLFVTRNSPNSHPFRSFPLGWCRKCCVTCWSTHITELSISTDLWQCLHSCHCNNIGQDFTTDM
jgi:hypothetical protein